MMQKPAAAQPIGEPVRARHPVWFDRFDRALQIPLAVLFFAIAAFFAVTTVCAIVNFAWRYPMFDQWRSYGTFIGLPFPENILQPDNGHRPIVPNFFRVIEMQWLAANQWLQISIGTTCIYLTCAAIAFCAWRERMFSLAFRAGGVLLAVLGVLWMGNVRMLLHGNESLHAYLITLSVVTACIATWQAHQSGKLRWLVIACIACTVATFCFGPGIASFAAVFLLGILLRVPWRWLLVPAGVAAACLIVYLFALPGTEGVRSVLDLQLLTSARITAQWLSAPWVNGWLGLANPTASWLGVNPVSRYERAIALTANAASTIGGGDWRRLSVILGALGIVGFSVRTILTFFRRTPPTRLETVALGVGAFAIASAIVIGIARLGYLLQIPDQVYADRYLLWPCLFWSSLSLLLLVDIARSQSRVARVVAIAFMLVLPAILFMTQRSQTNWGAAVYQVSERNAAALRSGVFDTVHFPGNGIPDLAGDLKTLDLLREHHLAMFADPLWERVGMKSNAVIEISSDLSVQINSLDRLDDGRNGKPAAHFIGVVGAGIHLLQTDGALAVLDENDTIAGLAEFSFVAFNADALKLTLPRKRGFDGYIRDYNPDHRYRLVWLLRDAQHALLLVGFLPSAT